MTELEGQIWNLVHNWCDEQSCEIPDFNRRVLMERILALSQPPVSGSLPVEPFTKSKEFNENLGDFLGGNYR